MSRSMITILLAFLYASTAVGQYLSRVADARTGKPVNRADVEVAGVGVFTTDEQGIFRLPADRPLGRFESEPASLTINITRVGYRPREFTVFREHDIDAGEDKPVQVFLLMPELILLEGVTVTAGRMPLPEAISGPVSIVRFDSEQVTGTTDPTEVLRRATGMAGRDYVNYSSLVLRGTSIEHTLVALDGIRLNSSQSGTFDLTNLPTGVVRRAEIVRGGGSALYGSSPVGGTVNLISAEPERLAGRLRIGSGSFGRRYLEAVHENRFAPIGYLVGITAESAVNNYSWTDDTGSSQAMSNADRERLAVFAKGSWRQGGHRFNLFGTWGATDRGVPGPRSWASDSARRDDRQGLAYLRHSYEPDERFSLDTRVSAGRFWQNYRDPTAFVPVSDTHGLSVVGTRADATYSPSGWITFQGGVELDQDRLVSSAIGDAGRFDIAGVGQVRVEGMGLAVQPSLRLERLGRELHNDSVDYRTRIDVASPRVMLSWSRSGYMALYASSARSFRAPTFNELYWPTDDWTRGNPGLEPEWATSFELGLRSSGFLANRTNREYRLHLGGYHNSLVNLIQWQPDDEGRWQPVNVASADITGIEADASMDFRYVGFSGNFNLCRARSEGERLLYRPEITARASGWVGSSWGRFDGRFNLSADYSGDRLTEATYPETAPGRLSGYALLDCGLLFGLRTGPMRTALSGGVRNLTDRRTETVRSYPMPGRTWYAELELGF